MLMKWAPSAGRRRCDPTLLIGCLYAFYSGALIGAGSGAVWHPDCHEGLWPSAAPPVAVSSFKEREPCLP